MRESLDGRRHPADEQVIAEVCKQEVVRDLVGLVRTECNDARRDLVADAPKVLLESHGAGPQVLHSPDGDRDVRECELEERARGDDMEARQVFVEVAQGDDGSRARLDLVQEEQVPTGNDAHAERRLECGEDGSWVEGSLEEAVEVTPAFEVHDVCTAGEALLAQGRHGPRLAHLASSTHD